MELDDATTHRNTRQQFARMKGLGDVVVRASGQPLYDLIFIRFAGEQDDVSVRSLVAAYVPAQLDSGEIGHLPICDYQGRLMYRQKITGLPTVFGEANGILLVSQSLLNELSIETRIVSH
jgi:hypothetical protein